MGSNKDLTVYQRGQILGMTDKGVSQAEIARTLRISRAAVQSTIKLAPLRLNGKSLPRTGRQRTTTAAQDATICQTLRDDPSILYKALHATICPMLSYSAMKRRLRVENLRKWRKLQRPYLRPEHAIKRLAWAQQHLNWSVEAWRGVVWSDECSIERGSGMKKEWVYRVPEDKYKPFAIQARMHSGRVSVMVWAAFSWHRRSELVVMKKDPQAPRGGVTGRVYLEMLQEQLPTMMDHDSIFVQDNAPIHTCRQVRQWLNDMDMTVMDWPPYSPDMNPQEHNWWPLKENVHLVRPDIIQTPGGADAVRQALKEVLPIAWNAIPRDRMQSLIKSMPRRCQAVVDADGWYTKY